MSDIITTLHPENDETVNLYPNVKKENIPNAAIDRNKLASDVISLLNSINELHPSGVDTSTNILAFTTNKGIYVATDNGHWYYWNGTQYADGGIYQTAVNYDECIKTYQTKIDSSNYLTHLPDLNSALDNTSYIVRGINSSNKPLNSPNNLYEYLLTTYSSATNKIQIISTSTQGIFTRYYSGTWTSWSNINNQYVQTSLYKIDGSNYSTYLPDLNSALDNTSYLIRGINANNKPLNMPEGSYNGLLITYSSASNKIQIMFDFDTGIYARYYSSSWTDWDNVTDNRIIINNANEFVNKINLAYILGDKEVIINGQSTYDLYSIMGGDAYFTAYDHTTNGYGLKLGNGCKYIFHAARIVFDNPNSNTNTEVKEYFSPFNIYGDCYIDGLHLEVKNCRYPIHDDASFFGIQNENFEIKNSYIYFDNRRNTTRPSGHCIGGGMAVFGSYKIIGNVFETIQDDISACGINYHQEGNQTYSMSNMVVANNVFVGPNSAFTCNSLGQTNRKSKVVCTNNKGTKPFRYYHTDGTTDSIDFYEFNNIVES